MERIRSRGFVSGATTAQAAVGLLLALTLALASGVGAEEEKPFGPPLRGEEAEAFLRTARVVDRKPIGEGITRPERLTLTDGTRTLKAAFKTINEHHPGMFRLENGGWEFDFRDSWKSEVAAYELDKLLGLCLVPPTVEREVGGRTGSVQIWLEGVMSEHDRQERGLEPKGPRQVIRWGQEIHCVRLLHQLTYNTDFRNVENTLLDPDFRVYAVDFSRAFRIQEDLLAPDELSCFDRGVLRHLEDLNRAQVEEHLGRWLDRMQIDGLLARRDKILEIVQKRLEENGPGRVLFGVPPPPRPDSAPSK
jgi:hypothetical protein